MLYGIFGIFIVVFIMGVCHIIYRAGFEDGYRKKASDDAWEIRRRENRII